MAKIAAFAGSPRKDGYSRILLDKAVETAKQNGAEVAFYDLNARNLYGCQGCHWCRTHIGCCMDDYLKPAYDDIADADAIIVATPIYFADITGQTKMWLDRMFPMLDGVSFSPRFPGKKVATIFSQGDSSADRFQPAIHKFHSFLQAFGWTVEDTILCHSSSSPDFTLPAELLEHAESAARALCGK